MNSRIKRSIRQVINFPRRLNPGLQSDKDEETGSENVVSGSQFFSSRRELSKPRRELLNPRRELSKPRRELKNLLAASYLWIVDMESLICPVEKLFP